MARTSDNDNYQIITDRIADALEAVVKGTKTLMPWQKPWTSNDVPHNGESGHVYQGINVLLTLISGFADSRWYTFNQVASGKYGKSCVRKGEKGTHIIKWLFIKKDYKETDDNGNEVVRHSTVPVLKTYVVFNHQQIGWEEGKEPKMPLQLVVDPSETEAAAEAFFAQQGAMVNHGGDSAFYSPGRDSIGMPNPETFKSFGHYLGVKAHEFIHWTGHESRCNRNLKGSRFGSDSYAFEELVAELGSAFLCSDLGIEAPGLDDQHLTYLANWIKVLRGDKYAIFTAAKLAREAVGFLHGQVAVEEENEAEAA